jgi:hypothetical protein
MLTLRPIIIIVVCALLLAVALAAKAQDSIEATTTTNSVASTNSSTLSWLITPVMTDEEYQQIKHLNRRSMISASIGLPLICTPVLFGIIGLGAYFWDRMSFGPELFPWKRAFLTGLLLAPCLITSLVATVFGLGMYEHHFWLGIMIELLALPLTYALFIRYFNRKYTESGISSPLKRACITTMAAIGMGLLSCLIVPLIIAATLLVMAWVFRPRERVVVVEDDRPPDFFS